MPGVRYEGWRHTRVAGDPAAGAPYLTTATKLLGYVFEDAKRNNLGVHAMRQVLDDGTVIVAEKHGDIPRITIFPVGTEGGEIPVKLPEDFVVHARTTAIPDGIDAEHPQQILRAAKEKGGPPDWKTYFYGPSTAGYAAFGLPKGTYVGLFTEGITHAGNLDWRGEDGERVSWGGPSSRYFLDPYTQPSAQYGKKVFMLGRVLLDMTAYNAAVVEPETTFPELWVLGAALRKVGGQFYLYVVHALIYDADTSAGTVPAFTIAYDSPYPFGDITTVLSRFTVLRDEDQPPAEQWSVANGSRLELYRGDIYNANTPWFFSPDATMAVSFALPESISAVLGTGVVVGPPSASQQIHRLLIPAGDAASLVSSSVSLAAGQAAAALTGDFDEDGQPLQLLVKRAPDGDTLGAFWLSFEGQDYLLYSEHTLPGIGNSTTTKRRLLWADLRANTFIFQRIDFNTSGFVLAGGVAVIEIWRDGIRVGTIDLDYDAVLACGLQFAANQSVNWRQLVDTIPVAPAFALYGIYTGSTGILVRYLLWEGALGIYGFRPYPPARHYGARAVNGVSSGPYVPFTTEGEFDGNRLDADGKYSVLGAASYDGVTMLSCYGFVNDAGTSVQWVDNSTLQTLTGVAGEKNRYHPIWLLGKPPK